MNKNTISFEEIWGKYPKKIGKKQSKRHFKSSVKTEEDFKNIGIALSNYLKSKTYNKGFVQNASTWFNNWEDWMELPKSEESCSKCKNRGKYVSVTGYDIICDCSEGKKPLGAAGRLL